MPSRPKDLETPQILKISEGMTLLVGLDRGNANVVLAVGTGDIEDFQASDQISLPIDVARSTPAFLQDFITSWQTSRASDRIREILEMEEATRGIGRDEKAIRRKGKAKDKKTKSKDRCQICGKQVKEETAAGWFKILQGDTVVWLCPDHDTREAFLFSQGE